MQSSINYYNHTVRYCIAGIIHFPSKTLNLKPASLILAVMWIGVIKITQFFRQQHLKNALIFAKYAGFSF